jgi:hypothetical protein
MFLPEVKKNLTKFAQRRLRPRVREFATRFVLPYALDGIATKVPRYGLDTLRAQLITLQAR